MLITIYHMTLDGTEEYLVEVNRYPSFEEAAQILEEKFFVEFAYIEDESWLEIGNTVAHASYTLPCKYCPELAIDWGWEPLRWGEKHDDTGMPISRHPIYYDTPEECAESVVDLYESLQYTNEGRVEEEEFDWSKYRVINVDTGEVQGIHLFSFYCLRQKTRFAEDRRER